MIVTLSVYCHCLPISLITDVHENIVENKNEVTATTVGCFDDIEQFLSLAKVGLYDRYGEAGCID